MLGYIPTPIYHRLNITSHSCHYLSEKKREILFSSPINFLALCLYLGMKNSIIVFCFVFFVPLISFVIEFRYEHVITHIHSYVFFLFFLFFFVSSIKFCKGIASISALEASDISYRRALYDLFISVVRGHMKPDYAISTITEIVVSILQQHSLLLLSL